MKNIFDFSILFESRQQRDWHNGGMAACRAFRLNWKMMLAVFEAPALLRTFTLDGWLVGRSVGLLVGPLTS